MRLADHPDMVRVIALAVQVLTRREMPTNQRVAIMRQILNVAECAYILGMSEGIREARNIMDMPKVSQS